MASPPQNDMSLQGESCFSFLHFCDNFQSPDRSAATNQPKESQEAPAIRGYHPRKQKHEQVEMKDTEELLAGELSKLSVEERAKALDDLHCVGEELQETPEMTQQSLAEFDRLVQTSTNRTYSIAVEQNRAFVEDPEFRLKFLRAKMHDARSAVHQMLSFLEQKAMYFGEDKVARDIVPSDLNAKEIEFIRSGFFQILDGRDAKGRVMVYNCVHMIPSQYNVEAAIRAIYHILYNMLTSMPDAKNGIVFIYYDSTIGASLQSPVGLNLIIPLNQFAMSLPLDVSAMHFCLHSSPGSLTLHNRMLQFLLKSVPQNAMARARLHYGSDLERQYKLRGYGIPLEKFPVDTGGKIRSKIQNDWCGEYLKASYAGQQTSQENAAMISVVGGIRETDILFGRGRLVQYHPGNVRFRALLGEHMEEYENLQRSERRNACVDYIAELVANGARFFKENGEDMWVVCEFEEAVGKALQFYRASRFRKRH